MAGNTETRYRNEVQKAVEHVRCWALELPLDDNLRHRYGLFADKVVTYIKKQHGGKEAALRRYEHASS